MAPEEGLSARGGDGAAAEGAAGSASGLTDSNSINKNNNKNNNNNSYNNKKPRGLLARSCGRAELLSLTAGIVLAGIQGVLIPASAVITGLGIGVLSEVEGPAVVEAMYPVLWSVGVLGLVTLALATGWQALLLWGGGRLAARAQVEYLKVILSRDVAWYDQHASASLPARMENELASIHICASTGIGWLALSGMQFLSGMALAFYSGWQLTIVVCAAIPALAICSHFLAKFLKASAQIQHQNFAKAGAVAEEALLAIRTVAAFGGERFEQRRFESKLEVAKRGGMMAWAQLGIGWGFINLLFACVYALAFWYGAHHLVSGSRGYTGSHVVTVLVAVLLGLSGLADISSQAMRLSQARVASQAIADVLGAEVQIEDQREEDKAVELPAAAKDIASIEFREVSFNYPSRPQVQVLRGVSLRILKGQKVALVGSSGAGKSTIIQLLERFYDPCAGEILVNGVPLPQLPVTAWRRQIGYVGQEPVLFATSVLENLTCGWTDITDEQALEAARHAQAFDFISSMPEKFQTFVGAGGGQMSGGQKQRIAIARALAKQPQILLLDEATSSLDSESQSLVQATIDGLQRSTLGAGLTTISVAHRLSTVRSCDVIFVLKQGLLLEQGSHHELMERQGEYFTLVRSQAGSSEEPASSGELEQPPGPAQAQSLLLASPPPSGSNHHHLPVLLGSGISHSLNRTGTSLSFGSWNKHEAKDLEAEEEEQPPHTAHALRRLLCLAKPEWPVLPLAVLATLVASSAMPALAICFASAIASLYLQPEQVMLEAVDTWCLWLLLVGGVSLFAELGKTGLFGYIQECLTTRLRMMAFASILRREIGFFDDPGNETSGLTAALEQHASRVANMMGQSLANSIGAPVTCLVGVLLGFLGSWQLALALLGLLPIVAGLAVGAALMANRPSLVADGARHAAAAATCEAVTNVRTVRALGAEEHSLRLVAASLDVWASHEAQTALQKGFALGVGLASVQLIYLAGFWISAKLIADTALVPAAAIQTLFCVIFGLFSASVTARFIPDSLTGRRAAQAAFRLIDQISAIDAENPSGHHRSLGSGVIEFERVMFRYPHRVSLLVLKSMSFRVMAGSSVALVGPSGNGKSTVLQLLLRFYDPTQGAVKIGSVDLRRFDVAWLRRQIGFVGQEPVLFDMSLKENVKYGCPEATMEQVEAAAAEAHMDYATSGQVRWDEALGLRGEKLSGGQKQRCAIARAVLRRPAILLLDEATSALDSAMECLVLQALESARRGRTSFTVAHRLSTIRTCDVIFVVNEGRIVEQGNYDELVALQGLFAKLATTETF